MNRALWKALRPHQWAKNVLVLAAPAGAGVLDQQGALWRSAVMFVAFCAASSAGYLVNDSIDREIDRTHPTKSARPIAAGEIRIRDAGVVAVVLVVSALAASAVVRPEASAVVGAYLVVTFAYSSVLKKVPYLEMALLSVGFVLRALGGAVAVDVTSSRWFLLVVSGAGVFVVARKRCCEKRAHAETTRPVLVWYRPATLDAIAVLAGLVAVTGHGGWAFDQGGEPPARIAATVAFAASVCRYGWLTRRDDAGGDPVTVLFGDRLLLGFATGWATAFLWAAGS